MSGTAIFIGLAVGALASKLFIPLLQIVYSSSEQIPPFRVISLREDYYKLYIIIAFILLIGTVVLARIISSVKMNNAIKLGED